MSKQLFFWAALAVLLASTSVVAQGPVKIPTNPPSPPQPCTTCNLDPLHGAATEVAKPIVTVQTQQTINYTLPPLPAVPITAPVAIWIAAQPSNEERVADLRRRAAAKVEQLKAIQFDLAFERLYLILTFQGDSPAAEWEWQEAREISRDIAELMKEMDELTGAKAEAETRYQARIQSLTRNREGNYSVHASDSAANVPHWQDSHPDDSSISQPNKPKGTKQETYLAIDKVSVQAGFKEDGKPFYEMKWDVVHKTRTVPDDN